MGFGGGADGTHADSPAHRPSLSPSSPAYAKSSPSEPGRPAGGGGGIILGPGSLPAEERIPSRNRFLNCVEIISNQRLIKIISFV